MQPGAFNADHAMAKIEREKVSSMGGVPTVMWRIVEAENFADYDLSSVTRIGYGGAPAAPELVERIKVCFPQVRDSLSTAYGLTESASVATAISGDDYFARPNSVGRPVPTVEAMVIDEDGNPAPDGTTGELALRGPTIMMRGYWNRPDANEAVFLPGGWFRTGDIARIDDYVRQHAPRPRRGAPFVRFPTSMWRNEEVLSFADWLRRHHSALPQPKRVSRRGLHAPRIAHSRHASSAGL